MMIWQCPKCRGRSFTGEGNLCWHCEERKSEPVRKSAREIGLEESIPAHFRWSSLSASELEGRVTGGRVTIGKIVSTVRAEGQKPYRPTSGLLLAGEAGTGKTSLACAMLRDWFQKTKGSALFVAAHDLAGARLQHELGRGEANLVDRASKVDLLLIDDIGSEPTGTFHTEIRDVIARRHNYDLPTWVTTGKKREEILERYGFGIARRIVGVAKVFRLGDQPS